ncbi:PAS domain S-box protein [Rossellomorea vietnamensis]|uniref:PAS domain S-box protein n=1 Tax=Rossellomorea vietnamensis TaxID=218284 RepID=A0A6I6UC52_9BACI|nr:PAS domain S-box protein [Rossellomorea vietnamensis]QHE60305.1 PAS domain S-box protein [Rossellomorea vietnamensis]
MNVSIAEVDYKEVMEYSRDPLIIHTDYKVLYINHAAEKFFRSNKESMIGASPLDIFQESSKDAISRRIQSAYGKPADVIEETVFRMDGTRVEVELYCHPVKFGDTKAIQTYVWDITSRKETEKNQHDMNEEINELSATIVPLIDDVAVLPLRGKIDQDKAMTLLDLIPCKVKDRNVNRLIIDFSGVYTLDRMVIDYLFKITNVLSLLGVHSIISGIRPELAVEAIEVGIDLSTIPTVATVKEALAQIGMTLQEQNES